MRKVQVVVELTPTIELNKPPSLQVHYPSDMPLLTVLQMLQDAQNNIWRDLNNQMQRHQAVQAAQQHLQGLHVGRG